MNKNDENQVFAGLMSGFFLLPSEEVARLRMEFESETLNLGLPPLDGD
jgi:hypothetical protein